ncbi:hypothetical protein H8356DRAFT_546162 [Neocallimastix lanati (nom. inval.)]|nr:hypothetical protein H8356DRAFT_546162 [Neocallimastix sp. JGI-2020a]
MILENIKLELIINIVIIIICFLSLGVFFISSLKRNKNIKLMKQLIYIFPLIFISSIYQIIIKIKNVFVENNSINYEELNTKLNIITGEQGGSGEELKKYVQSLKYFSVAVEIAIFIFYLYYYIAAYSYIYDVEDLKKEQIQRRNLENGTE